MKKIGIMLGLAGALAMGPAMSSPAGDEGWAALGGFIGGTIFSGIAHGGHHASHAVQVKHYGQPACRPGGPSYHVSTPRQGHYEYVEQKVWHDGYWRHGYDDCGRKTKTWIEGYYTIETVKVWIEAPRHRGRRSHDRVAHGYRY